MSEQLPTSAGRRAHPIRLVVTDDLEPQPAHGLLPPAAGRSRIAIWLALWAIAAFFVVFVAWVVGLFTGRVPDGLHTTFSPRSSATPRMSMRISGSPRTRIPGFTRRARAIRSTSRSSRPVEAEPPHDPLPRHPRHPGAHRARTSCSRWRSWSRSWPGSTRCSPGELTEGHAGPPCLLPALPGADATGYCFLLTQRYPSFRLRRSDPRASRSARSTTTPAASRSASSPAG